MLQLKNNTPFAAAIALFPDERGIDTLYTLVKASFSFFPQLSLLPEQPEPQKKDEYSGVPGESALILASDYHTGKSATDILVTGSAFSPEGQPVRQLDVNFNVADLHKTLRIFGDRHWESGRFSPPEPFTEMPLVYERAFGGTLLLDGVVHRLEERNPVGAGFTGDLAADEIIGWPLPNLENPRQLITNFRDRPEPACFAPVAPHWRPRVTFAGTYDEQWQQNRAPYLPEDYHPRFMNCAPPDQIYSGFLQGGEPVLIRGMHPRGDLNFSLPRVNLTNRVFAAGQETAAPFVLETVHLEPNQLKLSLVWRSAFRCDKRSTKIDQISVTMAR